jgi:O-antigen ligase
MIILFAIQYVVNPQILDNGRLTILDSVNENRFAMMFAQLAAFALGYTFFVKKIIIKIFSIMLSIISIYFILLSGSRSAFIGILLGGIFAIILLTVKNKKQKKIAILLLAFGIVSYLAFEYIISTNPILAYRFNIEQVLSSGGTRRWPRVITEIKYVIPNNLLFGVGLTALNEYLATANFMNDPGSSHNFIISMLTQIGIVGFIAYVGFYYKVIIKLIKSLSNHIIYLIPLLLILTAIFNGIGEVMYSERLFWNALSLAGLSLNIFKANKKSSNIGLDQDY